MSATTHRGWNITPATIGYDIQHPEYDRENEIDWRYGHADTVEAARDEIDRLLAEDAEWTEAAGILKTGLLRSEQAASCNVETSNDDRQQPCDDRAGRAPADLGTTGGRSGHDERQRDRTQGRGEVSVFPDEVTEKGWQRATPSQRLDAATVERDAADARRYRYLRDHCSYHQDMTWDQPAEWSIGWEFQQCTPAQAYGSFDKWIDAYIERRDAEEAQDAEEDARALATEPHQHGGKGA